MILTIDFETQSEADLLAVGSWAYSEHPTTAVICACWGVDDRPLGQWCPGLGDDPYAMPAELREAVEGGAPVEAHNVAFERSIWENVLVPRHGWVLPRDDQWRDTMAVACYYALPASLDRLASVLGFVGKDSEGARLISRYSKLHLKTARREIPEDDLRKFVAYCLQDVRIEQSVSDFLGDLPARELPVFQLDMESNRRGLFLDLAGIRAASRVVDRRAAEIEVEFGRLTGLRSSQRQKVLDWLRENGLPELPDLRADTLEELLEDDADPPLPQGPARRAVELRLAISKASTKKLDAMARQVGRDGRARWQTRYHGAVTGRNTGSGFQPLNLTRGWEKVNPEQLVRDIYHGDPAWLDAVYGDAMEAVSKASRHWIMAEPGNKLLAGDFSSIEAVVLACLAGEDWKIDLFRSRGDPYVAFASRALNRTVLPKSDPNCTAQDLADRQRVGKPGELAFGYQGALNAWLKFDSSGTHSDEKIIEFCRAWREQHSMVVQFWRELEREAVAAVVNPGAETGYRQIGFERVDEWLTMILPDGKRLWYWRPELRSVMPQWHRPADKEDCAAGTCDCEPRPQLTYMAQKSGQWRRVSTYGGKLTENCVQAVSRQILAAARFRARDAGYPEILTVYDEIVAEVPENFGSAREFEEIMSVCPGPWADGWPIRVEAWEGKRYKK